MTTPVEERGGLWLASSGWTTEDRKAIWEADFARVEAEETSQETLLRIYGYWAAMINAVDAATPDWAGGPPLAWYELMEAARKRIDWEKVPPWSRPDPAEAVRALGYYAQQPRAAVCAWEGCGQPFTANGRQKFCSQVCRQSAWRAARASGRPRGRPRKDPAP